jgi:hypothetical protein
MFFHHQSLFDVLFGHCRVFFFLCSLVMEVRCNFGEFEIEVELSVHVVYLFLLAHFLSANHLLASRSAAEI